MTATYWEIGRRIVEFEMQGGLRTEYGEQLLGRLARDLTSWFGRGFSCPNLTRARQFYLAYPAEAICSTLSNKFDAHAESQNRATASLKSSGDLDAQILSTVSRIGRSSRFAETLDTVEQTRVTNYPDAVCDTHANDSGITRQRNCADTGCPIHTRRSCPRLSTPVVALRSTHQPLSVPGGGRFLSHRGVARWVVRAPTSTADRQPVLRTHSPFPEQGCG